MDGEYTLSDGCRRRKFGTAGSEGQDFDILRLRIEEFGGRFEGKIRDRRKTERAETRLCGHGRQNLGSDGIA